MADACVETARAVTVDASPTLASFFVYFNSLDCIRILLEHLGPASALRLLLTAQSFSTHLHAEPFWKAACELAQKDAGTCSALATRDLSTTPHYISWQQRFAREHGPECAKRGRCERLRSALASQGLCLRSDSALCAQYINSDGAMTLQDVVKVMAEMDFYFRKTSYPAARDAIMAEIEERAVADAQAAFEAGEETTIRPAIYLELVGQGELSRLAKERALERYVQQNFIANVCEENSMSNACDDSKVRLNAVLDSAPPSLHSRIRELYESIERNKIHTSSQPTREPSRERRTRLRDAFALSRALDEAAIRRHIQNVRSLAQGDDEMTTELRLPPTLTRSQRALLHDLAESLGLHHSSEGWGSERALVIRHWQASDALSDYD